MGKPLIIRDTREKETHGYDYPETDIFGGTKIEKVEVGDYSIEGLTHLIFIDRKASTSEIAMNITEDRFKKLLERATSYKYRFLVCEFDWEDILTFPIASGIPLRKQKYIKITSAFLQSFFTKLSIEYDIHVLFAGNAERAEILTYNILKGIWKKECSEKTN